MITNLRIKNFRTFRDFEIQQLSRVNLFVGCNNAGKTSVLEAAEVLVSGTPLAITRSPMRREEIITTPNEERERYRGLVRDELDLSHLFHGRELLPGAGFSIYGDGSPAQYVECLIVGASDVDAEIVEGSQTPTLFPEMESEGLQQDLGIRFVSHLSRPVTMPLTPLAGLSWETRRQLSSRLAAQNADGKMQPVRFVGPDITSVSRLGALWNAVVLTEAEESVRDALRIIEPSVDRIAFISRQGGSNVEGFQLKLEGDQRKWPLGSMGDGMKHLLALSLNLVQARDGWLFVDEIDSGLHYSVMAPMWRLVVATARRLGVQVLASTHSNDCVSALASVYQSDPTFADDVSLHRIHRDMRASVRYDAEEILIASRNHMELRG